MDPKQELPELRAAAAERDARLAQATTDQAALVEQVRSLQQQLDATRTHEAQLGAEADGLRKSQADAVAAAQERYEGMSRRLLEETAQQRQAAQAEVARMVSLSKFAEKRQAALEARVQQLECDLGEARGQKEKALGEASALRYVNTSLRAQIDEFMRTLPVAPAPKVPGLARGRKRTPKPVEAKASKTSPT